MTGFEWTVVSLLGLLTAQTFYIGHLIARRINGG